MQEVNGIRMYKVTDRVLDVYQNHSEKNKGMTKTVLAKRLSVLIHNAQMKSKNYNSEVKYRYIFSNFKIDTNDITNEVYFIRWDEKGFYVSPELSDRIKEDFAKVGLNKSGTSHASVISHVQQTFINTAKDIARVALKDSGLYDAIVEADDRMLAYILQNKYHLDVQVNTAEIYHELDNLVAYS